jgi:hypothetical protein
MKMQQRMNAKEYAKARGLPVETIRRLCRTNVLRYVQRGKVYLVNIACADAYFEAEEMRRQEKLQRCTVVKPVNMRQANFKAQLADLRAEIL